MSGPQVGDAITTKDALDALPVDAVVLDVAGIPRTRRRADSHMPGGWTHAGREPLTSGALADGQPLIVVYLAGRPPRPERVVKAEALREAANDWQVGGWAAVLPTGTTRPEVILGMAQRATEFFRARADCIEGEL